LTYLPDDSIIGRQLARVDQRFSLPANLKKVDMTIPSEVQNKTAELAATLPRRARLPAFIAAASLPINRNIQEELRTWYTWIPQLLRVDSLLVSLEGDLSQLTWQAAAAEPEMTQALRAYLVEYPIPDESFVDLDRVLARFKPEQLGAWVTARKDSFELGWFMRPNGEQYEPLRPYLPPHPDLTGWPNGPVNTG
jgi:hypothetical protein